MVIKYNSLPNTVETGNWNIAKIYSSYKISKPIMEIDDLKKICWFGTSDLIDEFMTSDDIKTKARISALYRLIKTTELIIDNSLFAIKKGQGSDKDRLRKFKKELIRIEKIFPQVKKQIIKQTHNGANKTTGINEGIYTAVLDFLVDMNAEILVYLNNSDLIFTSLDEFDPEEYMANIRDEIVNQG